MVRNSVVAKELKIHYLRTYSSIFGQELFLRYFFRLCTFARPSEKVFKPKELSFAFFDKKVGFFGDKQYCCLSNSRSFLEILLVFV